MPDDKWTEESVRKVIVNPFYAINIDPALSEKHEPLTPRDEWIRANTRLLSEMGPEAWLRALLDVLEGDFVSDAHFGSPPSLPSSRQERRRLQSKRSKGQ
jgi:hypothetical protein